MVRCCKVTLKLSSFVYLKSFFFFKNTALLLKLQPVLELLGVQAKYDCQSLIRPTWTRSYRMPQDKVLPDADIPGPSADQAPIILGAANQESAGRRGAESAKRKQAEKRGSGKGKAQQLHDSSMIIIIRTLKGT